MAGHHDLEHAAAGAHQAGVQRGAQRRARAISADKQVGVGAAQRRPGRETHRAHPPLDAGRLRRGRRVEHHARAAPAVLDGIARQLGPQRVHDAAAGEAVGAVHRLGAQDAAVLVLEDRPAQRAVAG